MTPRASEKVVLLFSLVGFASGLLSAFVGSLSTIWLWTGIGLILLGSLVVSIGFALRLRWLSARPTFGRWVSASVVIIAAYPISVLVMIGIVTVYESWLSTVSSASWNEYVSSGDYSHVSALYIAATSAALIFSTGLRILTREFDVPVMSLIILAALITIPLSQLAATWLREPNWHLLLFPVGETLFGGLAGHWLLRANREKLASPLNDNATHHSSASIKSI